jgi:oligoendopeptidase F
MENANWNLDDIFELKDFEKLCVEARHKISMLDKYFAAMSPKMSSEDFLQFTKFHEECLELLHRLGSRPALMESTDQKDSLAIKLKNQVKDLELYFSEKIQPISLWLKGKEIAGKEALDDENAKRLFAANEDLYYVYSYSRLMGKYSLDEKSENILTAKDANGTRVITDLRDMIETELVFDFKPKDGKARQIKNSAELSSYTYSINPAEREAAFRARFEQYEKNIDKFFVAYQAIVKDWAYETKLRGFKSPISMRNVANHIDDKVIDTLIKVCSDNVGAFQNYFRFKAKELGVKKLSRFDLYAPIGESTETYKYSDAIKMVDDAFRGFSPIFADNAKRIISEKHIDSHPGDSKRGGAFCMTVSPSIDPYVLLNFAGKMRDVSTLAHELGHGVHSLYANSHSISAQHANLPLAETASTFGEMILFEKLLSEAKTNQEKKILLSDKLADSYATICRQNFIVKFEISAHDAIQKGVEQKDLSKLWLDNLKEQFGDSVQVDDLFQYEWSYIPHIIHTPFYCYAYNFGELLSMALYARYKQEGESCVPAIEYILKAGGAQDPKLVLQEVGIDMGSADFWQGSFELINKWQNELESL